MAEATHAKELSKSASKALILQKIKTAKAKQIQDPQRQNSKIHITDHGTAVLSSVTDSEKTNLDRVHASQSLKNSIPGSYLQSVLSKSNLYTPYIATKRVRSGEVRLRGLASWLHSSEETSRWWLAVGDAVSRCTGWESKPDLSR